VGGRLKRRLSPRIIRKDAGAQYRLAQAESLRAEVALEVHDKDVQRPRLKMGSPRGSAPVDLQPRVAEYHRILARCAAR